MSLIPEEHKEHVRNQLAENLVNPVRFVMFTQQMECQFCTATRQLVLELASLNDRIKAEIHDFVADSQLAKEYGIDKVPALVVLGEKDYGIRYYGIPFGYEFQTLMQSLVAISRGKADLAEETKAKLKAINVPVLIKVFVTLTCPHCPAAAITAFKFAVESDLIKAEVIDSGEFPQLALKYGVMGVPKIVINEKVEFVGAVPENLFLQQLLLAIQ
ncbi:MAG: thioredoxin family protein [Candidatus Bathyarchaeota archaeon]|jgi:glutaredoxin-like protein|nr:thioredoxin family protein [Candidatus Bathyarchaeota archaeon]